MATTIMGRRKCHGFVLLFLFVLQVLLPQTCCFAFRLPAGARIALGMEDSLKRDCLQFGTLPPEKQAWERDTREGYQLVTCLFRALERKKELELWFPRLDESANGVMAEKIVDIVSQNSNILCAGEEEDGSAGMLPVLEFTNYPKTPAARIHISWKKDNSENLLSLPSSCPLPSSSSTDAVAATEGWVEQTLCRLKLCPHVANMGRAATGLGTAGVVEGPIGIRLAAIDNDSSGKSSPPLVVPTESTTTTTTTTNSASSSKACRLAASVWNGITELADKPESEVSTLLIVATEYDNDFSGFVRVCDNLIQPCIQAAGADAIVGRAWFHPQYETSAVFIPENDNKKDEILPGHALPPTMVQGFLDKYLCEEEEQQQRQKQDGSEKTKVNKTRDDVFLSDRVEAANNAVRHTPHATVNLLRRSQLSAAKVVEAKAGNKRPNAIYARNVLRIIRDWGGVRVP